MSNHYKGLMLILDGIGDRASPLFGGLTPLEKAATPNLDRLVSAGMCGLVDPLIPGVPVATHTGTGALFGLAPRDIHRLSRGPVEAAGIGMPGQPGDVFLRGNFATLERCGDELCILDRRAGRIREGVDDLVEGLKNIPLDQGITATIAPATEHRIALRLSGPGLSATISDTDPGSWTQERNMVLSSHPLISDDKASVRTAELLNLCIHEVFVRLHDHPINQRRITEGMPPATGIITRGAGMALNLESFINHLGLASAVITGERTVAGLGRLLNCTVITDPRFTGSTDTDLAAKVSAARDALDSHDFVFLHIKATDIYSHDRDPKGKRAVLEQIDHALGPLLDQELVIGVTGDHSTDCNTGRHCGEPVPSLLYAPYGRRDSVNTFGESECARGGLGRIPSHSFLYSILDNMGYLHQYQPADWKFFKPRT
ncbi:MAG: 2,3-bisphosphoglycerate-independent phosphoglycerate mutase [Pseudomonadota bacterium]